MITTIWSYNNIMMTSYNVVVHYFIQMQKLLKQNQRRQIYLTLSWKRPLSYSNQSIDLQSKLMDWFLYDNGLRHERVKVNKISSL